MQKNIDIYAQTEVPQRSSLSATVMNELRCETKKLRDKSSVESFSSLDTAPETASSLSKVCSYCRHFYHTRNTHVL